MFERHLDKLIGKHVDELDTPTLVVDLDILERNLADMAEYSRECGVSLWPHTKTHKSVAMAKRQLALGAGGLTVAKTEEAEVMARAGGKRIFVAYPSWGIEKWQRLSQLARDNEITIALDSIETATQLAAEAERAGVKLQVLIDLDLGMRRTGVPTPAAALALAQKIEKLPALPIAGLFFYPGHIWEAPAKQDAVLAELSAIVEETLRLFDRAGISRKRVSGGSTPAAKTSHRIYGQTETRPGTYLFNDRNYVGIDLCSYEDCALTVLTTVVSCQVPGRAMVDAGSKTMSGDQWLSGDGTGSGWIVSHSPNTRFTEMSEEHGHFDFSPESDPLKVGQRLQIIPNHVCPAVNLHDFYVGTRKDRVEEIFITDSRGCVR